MKQFSYIPVFIFFIFLSGRISAVQTEDNASSYRILIIHSYTEQLSTYSTFGNIVEKNLNKKGIDVSIRTFYLDSEQYLAREEEERIFNFLESSAGWKPNIILVNDDQATYSLIACNHPLVKKLPILFSAVNFPNWGKLKEYPNVRGFWDKPDYKTNIRLIEKLYGKSKILFSKNDQFIGKVAFESIQKQLSNSNILIHDGLYETRAIPIGSATDTTKLYAANMALLKARSLLWAFEDKPYKACLQIILDFNVLTIGRLANVPNFTVINTAFNNNKGITGGYFTTLEIQAKEIAEAAEQILKGKNITDIPITESKKIYAFDWNEMLRFNIKLEDVPTNSIIYNLPFVVRFQNYIITAVILLFLTIIYIIFHLIFMYRREYKRKQQAQVNLLKEKKFLRLALEGGNTYAWRLENGEFIFEDDFFTANKITPRAFTLANLLSMAHPDDQEFFRSHINDVYQGMRSKATTQCRFDFNGDGYIWWELRYNHGDTQNDQTQSVIGLCLNIQSFKEKEMQLKELQEKAEEANNMKSAFLANMSHEIRTPLNAIVGFSNLLQEEEDLSEEEKLIFKETINKNSSLLLNLINDILELSRIESGRLSFFFDNYKLNELMDEIYQTHHLLVTKVSFRREIPTLPLVVHVDRHRFIQVITNFINNAVKFTEKGHIILGYQYHAKQEKVYIYVEDTGKGMSEDALKKVFERFYKQDEFAQGTGLGLAICKTIAERLDGNILVTSEEGKGSRFTLVIPTLK